MEIIFAGICCWVDAPPPATGKVVVVRNATGGGLHRSAFIPPHHAVIHVKRDQVVSHDWPEEWADSEGNLLYYFTGDQVTFTPPPSGGQIDLSIVPRVRGDDENDPICPAADEIRIGFLEQPHRANVLALVHVPEDADARGEVNQNGAVFVSMTIAQAPVTITAKPFDGCSPERSLTITDPNARVFIANVTLTEYLAGVGASEDHHRYLVCDIFKADTKAPRAHPSLLAASFGFGDAFTLPVLEHLTASATRRPRDLTMRDFLDTLAAGCSDTRWP